MSFMDVPLQNSKHCYCFDCKFCNFSHIISGISHNFSFFSSFGLFNRDVICLFAVSWKKSVLTQILQRSLRYSNICYRVISCLTQCTERTERNRIENTFKDWNSMHHGFRIYFAWKLRLTLFYMWLWRFCYIFFYRF